LQSLDEVTTFEEFSEAINDPARAGGAQFRVADADYFRAMDIPLVDGRLFDERDTADAPHVAVISASLAAERFPGENPIGKAVFFGNMDGDLRPFTVVGVVGDVQEYGLGAAALPTFYTDYRQRPRTAAEFHIAIEGTSGEAALIETARRIASEIDPEVPVELYPLADVVSGSVADRRFVLLLLGAFGALALVLATTGVYGVISYAALQRTSEMGVRMALGATGRDVSRLLVRQGAALAVVGVVAGVLAAFVLSHVLASFVYGIGVADPMTFSAVAVALLAAACLASWVPALRASRVEPVDALRHE
jgi:putative ABC transport system permease protein